MMVAVVSLAMGGLTRADLLTHVLQVGDVDGGGSGSAVNDPGDLIAWAGVPKPITLGQLLQVAVRDSPQLKSATLDIEAANAQIQESQAIQDWNIQAQVSGQKTAGFFSGIAIASSEAYTFSGDLTRQLPTNGTLDLHVSSELSKGLESLGKGIVGTYKNWFDQVSVSLTQPLLEGRGRWLYRANEDKAELSHDIAVLARRQAAISMVETVVSGYWDLVLAERQVAITKASLQLARERLRVTELGVRGGKTAQAEVPAVLQIIATRQGDLLSGELGVLNASFALRRTVGMPIGPGELALRVDEGLDIDLQTPSLSALLDRAYAASPQLAELAGEDKNATIDIEVNDNGMLPQLDAQVSVGPIGQDSKLPDGTGGTFANATKNLVGLKSMGFSGSLTFSRSVERSQVIGRSRELRATRQKIRVNAADVKAQIAQAMAQAVAQLELAKRRVALADQAIQLANENIRIETDRFDLGRSTNFDVLNRLEDERQAELTKAQAMVDWHKARVTVLALTGELLPAYGMTVP